MAIFFEIAGKYGLFVALVVYVLYENKQRENRYLSVIEALTDEVKERLSQIEKWLHGKKNN